MLPQLMPTLVALGLAGAGVTCAYLLGARVERDALHRKARRYHRIITRPFPADSHLQAVRDQQFLREYLAEVGARTAR